MRSLVALFLNAFRRSSVLLYLIDKAELIWKHGLRASVLDTTIFSPIPYSAGQRGALVPGTEQRVQEITRQSQGANCFWSSSRGKTPYNTYSSLPEGCLWLMLVAHCSTISKATITTSPHTPEKVVTQSSTANVAAKLPQRPRCKKLASGTKTRKEVKKKTTPLQEQGGLVGRSSVKPALDSAATRGLQQASRLKFALAKSLRFRCRFKATDSIWRNGYHFAKGKGREKLVDNSFVNPNPDPIKVSSSSSSPVTTDPSREAQVAVASSSAPAESPLNWPALPDHSFMLGDKDFKQAI